MAYRSDGVLKREGTDTIAAIATPAGAGGIGVVKISGAEAIRMALPLFRPVRDESCPKSHRLYYGHIIDPGTGKTIDEVLFTIMRAPHTYTREDVVEIQAHGSRCGLYTILELVLKQGARLAKPGEFTMRAFLNGRIDLSQAEAVIEVVSAQTKEGLELATRQLKGDLSKTIESARDSLKGVLVEVEAAIDFPEDVEEIIQPETFAEKVEQGVIAPLESLLANYDEGHIYRDGISAIIVGRPNVGKSSLMNQLLQKERSIVTTIPGTTRDFIEETVNIKGIPLRLIDTAGLHDAGDTLEEMGMKFTRKRLNEAEIALFMIDSSMPVTDEDLKIYGLLRGRKSILIINKTDLPPYQPVHQIEDRFPGLPCVRISALYNKGIDKLKDTVFKAITDGKGPADLPAVVPNLRHKVAIERALSASRAASEGFKESRPSELIAIDIREALDALGEITGSTTTEDILEQIFSRFCIGK